LENTICLLVFSGTQTGWQNPRHWRGCVRRQNR